MGKGHYYENHYVENQKEHRKNTIGSDHHKSSFYLITTSKVTKITTSKVVDHYYENQNVEKNKKNIESLSFV
jgi:hypothetical protein